MSFSDPVRIIDHIPKDFRKLFKTPISERWGKQICLNE